MLIWELNTTDTISQDMSQCIGIISWILKSVDLCFSMMYEKDLWFAVWLL